MEILSQNTTLGEQLVSSFTDFESRLNGAKASAIHAVRKEALEIFNQKGFPSTKDEEWKYTNLQPILKNEWLLDETDVSKITQKDIEPFLIKGSEYNLLLFVNGKFVPSLSNIKDEGITACSLSEAIHEHSPVVEKHFTKYLSPSFNAFSALNTAFAFEGAFVHVPKNKSVQYPIEILSISGYESDNAFRQLRHLVVAEEGAEFTVIENNRSFANYAAFTNVVSEVVVASNAKVYYHKLQLENDSSSQVNTTQIYQAKDSHCDTSTITLGGKLVRNDLNFKLDDKNCESHLYGLYLPAGHEHFDNHTFVDHAKPNCFSNEFYKGIVMDSATAVFNGKIIVREDAQKTNAFQSNKNVLLSPDAKVDTKPQLEIFADDVKCSHGATVGQLDEEALFYLQSRGIGKEQAHALLVYAFAQDVLQNITLPGYKEYLEDLIRAKLNK